MDTGQRNAFIAKTLFGLEGILAEEIRGFGGENVQVLTRAVLFEGNNDVMYRVNFCSYFTLRVLKPVFEFQAVDEEDFYEQIKAHPWETYFTVLDTFLNHVVTNSETFTHSQFLALKAKDAIADRFMERQGKRPSVHTEYPKFMINIQITENKCRVSLDCTGESLHKRGYRLDTGPAPMNEVLAAGIIRLSGWDEQSLFIDPMCGSGTFLVEAALQATKTPPGKFRKHFLFMNFNDFDRRSWVKVKNGAMKNIRKDCPDILGCDISKKLIQVAEANVIKSNMDESIRLKCQDFFELNLPEKPVHVLFNPPYGERLHRIGIENFFQRLGTKFKHDFAGKSVWIISGNKEASKHLNLKASQKYKLFNGKLEVMLLRYDMYEGSQPTAGE